MIVNCPNLSAFPYDDVIVMKSISMLGRLAQW